MTKLFILLTFCVLLFAGCGKDSKYHYDGQVLSRHNIPLPNARVSLGLGEGGHSGSLSFKTVTANISGNFVIEGRFGYHQFPDKIKVERNDSGEFEISHITSVERDMVLKLQ